MRIVAALLFSLATFTNVLPAAAHGTGVNRIPPPPIGCFPWSGCRK